VTSLRRMRLGLVVLAVIVLAGTAGFVIIDGASVFNAFYMVMITITTVGFEEVIDLSTAGRAWALVLVASGFGVAFYTAVAGIEYLIDLGEVRRRNRMQNRIKDLSGHVIVCGFGRVGRATLANLQPTGVPVVVIEQLEDRAEWAEEAGAFVVHGDATHNDVLVKAGVERASALIACVVADSDNLVIALSTKSIRPDLRVICRATEPESERKLRLAGADGVVTPQAVGAERLAALALQPELAQIFDVVVDGRPVEFHVEELDVQPGSAVDGLTLRECGIRQESGASILALEDQKVAMQVNPGPDARLKAGDRLVLVGTKEQVERAARLLHAG
jgi:voltage-gated potassium channel